MVGSRSRFRAEPDDMLMLELPTLPWRWRPRLLAWLVPMVACGLAIGRAQDASPPASRSAPAYPDHQRLLVVRDGLGQERQVRTLADWDVRRDHILAHFQEVAGNLPGGERRVPLDIQVISTMQERGFIRKKISFATEPGDRVPAWLLIPDRARARRQGPRRALPASDDRDRQGRAGRAWAGTASSPTRRELAERGYVTLAPDYPNFGEYKLDVYDLGYASATMKAIWNNLRAVDLPVRSGRGRPAPDRRHRPLARRP